MRIVKLIFFRLSWQICWEEGWSILSEFLLQDVCSKAQEFVFLKSSQMLLMLGPHFENSLQLLVNQVLYEQDPFPPLSYLYGCILRRLAVMSTVGTSLMLFSGEETQSQRSIFPWLHSKLTESGRVLFLIENDLHL